MKIMFVVSAISAGGAERVMVNLANRWADAHQVTIVTIRDTKDFYEIKKGLDRIRIGVERTKWFDLRPLIRIIGRIRQIAREINPDFVISFVLKTNIFTLIALLFSRFPVVICEHSILERSDIDRRVSFLRKILYPFASRITVLSEPIKKEFLRLFTKINPGKVIVVPNPIELDSSTCIYDVNTISPIHNQQGKKSIVSLGRLVPLKGYDSLISAFHLLSKMDNEVFLRIYGEGPERQRLENLIHSLHLGDRITLPGLTADPKRVLGDALLYGMSSEFEGMPMGMLEAMHEGLPVIAFEAPGVNEYVIDGYNGRIVSRGNLNAWANAAKELLGNPESLLAMSLNAKDTVECFTPSSIDRIWFDKVLIYD